MKKRLAVLAAIAVFGAVANADDKGTEFKFGGEVMQRYYNSQGQNFGTPGFTTATSSWLGRNQFHVNAISSDKLQAYFDFIHTHVWGAAGAIPTTASPYTTGGNPSNTAATPALGVQNALQVSEAWLWWKMSDMASLRSGRQALNYGDGLVFSKNDWLASPFTADGIMARLSWDFMDLDVGGGVLGDAGLAINNTDAEVVFYGAYASFKNMPDVLKTGELFVAQINEDGGIPTASIFLPSYNTVGTGGNLGLTNIGIHLKGGVSQFDYRFDGVYQTGKQKNAVTVNAAPADQTFTANMLDLEAGYSFPEFMKARVFVNYHRDTGDDSTDRTQQHAYQPLFYDRHMLSRMNIIGWGNLTDIRFGASLSPSEETSFGLQANMFSRSSAATIGGTTFSPSTLLNAVEGNMYNFTGTTNGSSSDLGSEYDLWVTHNYGHGFSAEADLGFYNLGGYFKPTGATTSNPIQVSLQAKYVF